MTTSMQSTESPATAALTLPIPRTAGCMPAAVASVTMSSSLLCGGLVAGHRVLIRVEDLGPGSARGVELGRPLLSQRLEVVGELLDLRFRQLCEGDARVAHELFRGGVLLCDALAQTL